MVSSTNGCEQNLLEGSLKPRRIRDPVHDLIPFGTDKFEQMVWRLLQRPEFQRLRRIKQLGFTELVFPGATHTRFAHSVGVFHTARQLAECVRRQIANFSPERAEVAMAAALVHDLGHGPFSHAFEAATAGFLTEKKKHEHWTSEIVLTTGIGRVQESYRVGLSEEVSNLILSDT